MTDFDLPPRRVLPEEVRDGIRLKLQEGMDQPRRRRSWRGPAVAVTNAAAAVAVLVGGAVVLTTDSGAPAPPASVAALPPGLSLDPQLAAETLDRCWTALRTAGKDGAFPPRPRWRPVANTRPHPGLAPYQVTVLARAEDKPVVCDTTDTTVTVSDPNAPPAYAPGTSTAALLASPNGILAGIGQGVVSINATHPPGLGGATGANQEVPTVDGLFLWTNAPSPVQAAFTVNGGPLVAPPAALSVVDRPTPGVDRSSERGRLLGACLAESGAVVPDPGSFQPGASLVEGPATVLTGTYGERIVFCEVTERDGVRHYHVEEPPAFGTGPVRALSGFANGINWTERAGGQGLAGGWVPPETARMEVRRGGGKAPLVPVVANGTFLTVLPEDFAVDPGSGRQQEDVTVALYDARDELILEQRVRFPGG